MRRFTSLLVTLLLLTRSLGVCAQELSMEEKLAAIRKSLVEAALEGPTRVTSTQWIDAQGVLRESSSFRSGVEVRGVRVIGYSTDSEGEASAKLQWQGSAGKPGGTVAQAGATGAGSCKPSALGRMQHLLGLQWHVSGRFSAEEQNLIEEARGHWLGQLRSTGEAASLWRITPKPRSEGRSAYEQALLGAGVDDLPWVLELTVVGIPGFQDSTAGWTSAKEREPVLPEEALRALPRINWGFNMPSMVRVQLQVRLLPRNQSKPVLLLTTPMTLIAQDSNWGVTQLNPNSRAQVLEQAQNHALELYKTLVCQTVVGEVTQAQGKQIRINLGAAAGVRVGDTWVLADAGKLPQRALEPGNANQTVMARVQYVSEHFAQLAPMAGPAQNVQARWAAWSAEDGH